MKKIKKYWKPYSPKSIKNTASESDKKKIEDYFQPLIEGFKKQYIQDNPNKEFNYLVDIYSKWYQNYFYLCEKYKSESANRTKDEFEEKFVRLKQLGKDQFELSYFRHTRQWQLVAQGLTLDECKDLILSNPVFHPIG